MPNQGWCERVRLELMRQGLPKQYVERLIEELSDHAADLFKEDLSMQSEQILETRIGLPHELAETAKAEFHRRTFAGRHPWLMFVAAPVPVVIAAIVGTFLLMAGVAWLGDLASGGTLSVNDDAHRQSTDWEVALIYAANSIIRFVPFFASALLFVRLGQRAGRQAWSVGACFLVALFAFLFVSVVTVPAPNQQGMWMLGLGWKIAVDQLLQGVVPLILGMWVLTQLLVSRRMRVASTPA